MQYTENYSLRKPQMAETASVSDLNYNSDRIDAILADDRQISVAMYVSGNTYNTGDLVGYENPSTHHIRVYRCLVDNVTGTWDSTKWTLTNLADEILDAKASGGTEVEANPTGTASDTLNTVEIDGVIYAVGGDSANQNIADAFSELQTYAVGDYCIYESILYKCTTAVQTAGAWDSTKWTSCVVTDEMGSGGGGGTTVIANPQGTPTDTLNTVQIGQTIFDIAGGGGGVYIDTNNVIVSYTTLSGQALSYTASQDCAVIVDNVGSSSGSGYVYIDGAQVGRIYSSSGMQVMGQVYYLREGQTITTNHGGAGGVNVAYAVYGLMFTLQNLQPVIYSTEEREIGVWTDAKPLYQKTFNIGAFPNTATKSFAHNIANVDTIWVYDGFAYGSIGSYSLNRVTNSLQYQWETRVDDTYIYLQDFTNFSNDFSAKVVLRYTKTTDQPGSGTWTPQGVPAVHYSTNEQVVGTWIDGGTLYERTYSIASVPQSTSYSFENDASDIIPHSFNGVYTDDATRQIPNPVSSNPIVVYKYNNKLTIQNSSNHILTNVEITVRYTKTTS